MFMISREAMNSAISLRDKIGDPAKTAECIADVDNMIRSKESHLARADWGTCCGNICNLVPQIESELQILQNTLEALRKQDRAKASALLEDYIALLQRNYEPEPEHW